MTEPLAGSQPPSLGAARGELVSRALSISLPNLVAMLR
jgi:hypothetical protein